MVRTNQKIPDKLVTDAKRYGEWKDRKMKERESQPLEFGGGRGGAGFGFGGNKIRYRK